MWYQANRASGCGLTECPCLEPLFGALSLSPDPQTQLSHQHTVSRINHARPTAAVHNSRIVVYFSISKQRGGQTDDHPEHIQ